MSSPGSVSTLELAPRQSMRAFMLMFWLHLLVAVLALFAMEPGVPMLLLTGAIGGSWLALRRHPALGFGSRALVRLTWHADGEWTLHEASGRRTQAQLLGSSYRHPRLLVLNFRAPDGRRWTRLLLGDELEPQQFRRLRARLALEGAGTAEASDAPR